MNAVECTVDCDFVFVICRHGWIRAFNVVINETDSLAGQHELVVESMHSKVKDGLKNLAKEISSDRRKHMADGSKQLEHLKKAMEALDRVNSIACDCYRIG